MSGETAWWNSHLLRPQHLRRALGTGPVSLLVVNPPSISWINTVLGVDVGDRILGEGAAALAQLPGAGPVHGLGAQVATTLPLPTPHGTQQAVEAMVDDLDHTVQPDVELTDAAAAMPVRKTWRAARYDLDRGLDPGTFDAMMRFPLLRDPDGPPPAWVRGDGFLSWPEA